MGIGITTMTRKSTSTPVGGSPKADRGTKEKGAAEHRLTGTCPMATPSLNQ